MRNTTAVQSPGKEEKVVPIKSNQKSCWSRKEVANKLSAYEDSIEQIPSQRSASKEIEVARSTVRYWLERQSKLGFPDKVKAFVESPEGLAFIHRIVIAAQFSFQACSSSSIRDTVRFLELSHLNKTVAGSFGTLQKLTKNIEEQIHDFEAEEKHRLSKDMPNKKVSICQDETYHPEICLVAIEPVSNFILLEKYSDKRDAESWSEAMGEATEGLNIEVVQSVSDEAKGIKKHVEEHLSAHHSPDLFHVQQELTKATSGALSSKTRKAQVAYDKACKKNDADEEAQQQCKVELEACELREKEAREAKRDIGSVYHPYDLETGEAKTSEAISKELNEKIESIEVIAKESFLKETCMERIQKAQRVVPYMTATIAFFWTLVKSQFELLELPEAIEDLAKKMLLPSIYLDIVSRKAKKAEDKAVLKKRSAALMAEVTNNSLWSELSEYDKKRIIKSAKESVQYFQRSSSCVEGRNGQLSLYHHSFHRLSERKLKAKTIIHNYYTKGFHGKTPAEKFFEKEPDDLFEWTLKKIELPARPNWRKNSSHTEGVLENVA